jgi:hypothetical protein
MKLTKGMSIVLIIVIILGISIPIIGFGVFYAFNYQPEQPKINWTLSIIGEVEPEVNISYQQLLNASLFPQLIDEPFNYTKSNDESSLINFSGVKIWDIFQVFNINYTGNAIRFVDYFGAVSPYPINITTVEQNASDIIVSYSENGVLYSGPPDGYGYLRSIVDYEITKPVCTCSYATKWLAAINVTTI